MGDPSKLEAMLNGTRDIPPFVRAWLADLAQGEAKRWRGLTILAKRRAAGDGLTLREVAAPLMAVMDYEAFKDKYANQRKAALSQGKDVRGMPGDEQAASEALKGWGIEPSADPLRTIKRLKARLKNKSPIDLDYTRKG